MNKSWRDPEYVAIIHSRRWQRIRLRYLVKHPLCEACEKAGKTKPAQEIHHITPISAGSSFEHKEALAFNEGNLMALCHECHQAIHSGNGWHSGNKRMLTKAENIKRSSQAAEGFIAKWITNSNTSG